MQIKWTYFAIEIHKSSPILKGCWLTENNAVIPTPVVLVSFWTSFVGFVDKSSLIILMGFVLFLQRQTLDLCSP